MKINKYELARKLGISHQAVYKWFSGQSRPSFENLVKMSKILNVTVDKVSKLLK